MTAVLAAPVSLYKSKRKKQCGCCPYGYHIDTDFVRYCESVAEQGHRLLPRPLASRRPSDKPSLTLLLGITYKSEVSHVPGSDEPLADAVRDFERAFVSAGGKGNGVAMVSPSRVLPSSRVPSTTEGFPPIPRSATSSDSATLPSRTSSQNLQIIRKQMASSLAEIKRLEEEVKQVPILQDQIVKLQAERERLNLRLSSLEAAATSNQISNESLVKKRSISVGASVITREVGVNPRQLNNADAAVMTDDLPKPHSSIENLNVVQQKIPSTINSATQTLQLHTLTSSSSQTIRFAKSHVYTQTIPVASPPTTLDRPSPERATKTSNHTVYTQTQIFNSSSATTQTAPPPRTSFARTQTTPTSSSSASTQTLATQPGADDIPSRPSKTFLARSIQTIPTVSASNFTQTPPLPERPSSPPPVHTSCAHTQTIDPPKEKPIPKAAVQTQTPAPAQTCSSPCQTVQWPQSMASTQTYTGLTTSSATQTLTVSSPIAPTPPVLIRSRSALSGLTRRPAAPAVAPPNPNSRIPRPIRSPTALRAFGRQLTYTVTPPTKKSLSEPNEWSSFESNSERVSGKENQRFQGFPPTPATPSDESYLWVSNSSSTPTVPAEELSNEIKAALKVLNDGLKSADAGASSSLNIKSAIDVVQQEWFKVTSDKDANPHNVEELLDYCEELSSQLLHYVVNMSDNAGNTALHYAVSYENFDVVSVLLDSKVCDINKKNRVGYTPVMLLMLLEVKSLTDKHVVRRLLQLADVNIRAKNKGQTALMLAVSHDRIDNVEMLIEAGADLNIQDDDGNTALMVAAEYGLLNMVKFLLAQPDCDLNIKDNDGNTAVNVAVDCGNIEIGVLLYAQQHFSRGTSPSGSVKLKSTTRTRTPTPTSSPLPSRKSHE